MNCFSDVEYITSTRLLCNCFLLIVLLTITSVERRVTLLVDIRVVLIG